MAIPETKPQNLNFQSNKIVWTGAIKKNGGTEVSEKFTTESSKDYSMVVTATYNYEETVGIQVVDLDKLKVKSNRTTTPKESQYLVKKDEFYDDESTFKFELDMDGWGTPVEMNWEFWETSWSNSVVKSGSCSDTGAPTSVLTLDGSSDVYDDDCFIRFYSDVNSSGDSEGGYNDPKKDSPYFRVYKKKLHSLTVYDGASVGTTKINEIKNKAEEILLKRDSADDYRAAVKISITPAEWQASITLEKDLIIITPGSTPGSIITTKTTKGSIITLPNSIIDNPMLTDEQNKANAMTIWNEIWKKYCNKDSVYIMNQIDRDNEGNKRSFPGAFWPIETSPIFLVKARGGDNGHTFAHELGHKVGNADNYNLADSEYIMFGYKSSTKNQLNRNEALKYHE